jgi:hypothetical protein
MRLIQSITVGTAGLAAIEFTSLPADADHLYLTLSAKGTAFVTDSALVLSINGTATGSVRLEGNGSQSTVVNANTSFTYVSAGTSNNYSYLETLISNYRASGKIKTILGRSYTEANATATRQVFSADQQGTAAFTSLSLSILSDAFEVNSVASLYAIRNASGGATITTSTS